MTRHGKHNSSRADFTHAEYRMLTHWGSQRQRLTSDSMRSYNQCALCLNEAREPSACNEGHVFCRECILEELLQQKRDAVEVKGKLERLLKEQEREREEERERARRRILMDFERTSGAVMGGGGSGGGGLANANGRRSTRDDRSKSPESRYGADSSSARNPRPRSRSRSPPRLQEGKESTLSSLPSRIAKAAQEAERDALSRLEKEQAEARAAKLPAYWLPSLTPQADGKGDEQRRFLEQLGRSETRCRVGSLEGHPLSIKSLIPIHFTQDQTNRPSQPPPTTSSSSSLDATKPAPTTAAAVVADKSRRPTNVCPSCRKVLSNSITMSLLRRCGHVYCSVCVGTFYDAKALSKSGGASFSTPSFSSSSSEGKVKGDGATLGEGKGGEGEEKEHQPLCLECGKKVKDLRKDVVKLKREGTGFAAGGNVVSESRKVAFQG